MQALTNRSKSVDRRPMSAWEKLYLGSIVKGMGITLTHFFKKKASINYPEEKRPFSPVFRGLHVLNRDEEGRERCTACGLCAVACPAEAITMEAAERKEGEENLYREEKYAARYEINMLRCIFCGFCEDACPTEAIVLGDNYELSFTDRNQSIYDKNLLLEAVPEGAESTPRKTEPGVFTRSVPEMEDPRD